MLLLRQSQVFSFLFFPYQTRLICPSCLMFGPHKGENVCTIEEAAKLTREKLDEATKSGRNKLR